MIANFQWICRLKKNLEHYKHTHLKETYWSVLGGKCFHMHRAALSISKTDNHFKDITSKRSVWNWLNILVWPWWSLYTVTGENLLTSSFLCLWNANLALWHEASLKASPSVAGPKQADAMQSHVLDVQKWGVCDPRGRTCGWRAVTRCH